jgi:polyisoprenoid-binding protein YceI
MPHPRGPMAYTHVLTGTLLLLPAGFATAAPFDTSETVFTLNPTESQVDFTLTSVLHTIHGTFRVKRGILRFDPATAAVSGERVVDATSGVSGNRTRDRKMSHEILASDRYPEIVFVPLQVRGSVAPQGASQVDVDGTLSTSVTGPLRPSRDASGGRSLIREGGAQCAASLPSWPLPVRCCASAVLL